MSTELRIFPETVRTIAHGDIAAGYMGVGTSISNPARIIMISNLTNVSLMFSFDGVNDHFPLPSNGFLLLDVTANKTMREGCFIAEGERLYVKQLGAPTSGSVYFTSFYGEK